MIVHEIAHIWFCNRVTRAWWNDFWLNEGFASEMGDKLAGRAFPEFRTEMRLPA
jgi:aminopeptidase N